MDYKETHISFLYNDLIKEYGSEQGKRLYALMCKKFANLYQRYFDCMKAIVKNDTT